MKLPDNEIGHAVKLGAPVLFALWALFLYAWPAHAGPLSCDNGFHPNPRFRFYTCTVPPGIGLTPEVIPNPITGDTPVTWPYPTGWIVDEQPTQPMTVLVKFDGWGSENMNWDFAAQNKVVMKTVYTHYPLSMWQAKSPRGWPPLDFGGPLMGLDHNGARWQATIEEIANRGYAIDWNAGITLTGNCFGGAASITRALSHGAWQQKVAIVDAILPGMSADPPHGKWWRGEAAWTYDEMISLSHRLHLDELKRTMFRIQAASFPSDEIGFNEQWGKEVCDVGVIYCYMTWSRSGHAWPDGESPFPYLLNSTQLFPGPDMRWRWDEMQIVPTESTANYVGERGHWNQGIAWNSNGVIDSPNRIVVPIRYLREIDMGPGLPDQPMVASFKLNLRPERFEARKNTLVHYSLGGEWKFAVVNTAGQITIRITLGSGVQYHDLTIEQFFVEGC